MKTAKKTRKTPKKISKKYLENAALYYLQRYATSVENFRCVLVRKIKRSCQFHKTPIDEFLPLVDELVQRYTAVGLLNDAVFARAKTASLRRQGKSARAVQSKLQQKGVTSDDIERALEEVDEDADAEFQAALKIARKKKIGPFRIKETRDPKDLQKELAILGRAGFSYEIARKLLNFSEDE